MTTELLKGNLYIKVGYVADPEDPRSQAISKQTIATEQMLEYSMTPAREMATMLFQDLFDDIWGRRTLANHPSKLTKSPHTGANRDTNRDKMSRYRRATTRKDKGKWRG